MALLEPLYRVSEICASHGVENVVICPGSRSAALTLAFVRNKKFRTKVITDERSAAFVALGMAQAGGTPTVLICTSGTAALNFSPAVAEAYFQGVPLLVLTADRPPEWINQHDGQTIFQQNIYGKHIVKAYDFPVDYTHPDAVWMIERQTCEALSFTRHGPVHINVPIREPFYPEKSEVYSGVYRHLSYLAGAAVLPEDTWSDLMEAWNRAGTVLIAIGQNHESLRASLEELSKDPKVNVLADVISNVSIKGKVSSHDTFLGKVKELPPPDLLITCGKSFISKPLKQFFRKNKPAVHWHVEDRAELIDPLQSVTAKIMVPAGYFLQELAVRNAGKKNPGTGAEAWRRLEAISRDYLARFLGECAFGELKAMSLIFEHLQPGDTLHLGNSMPVRYANLLGAFLPEGVTVFANRGTSGIEGVVSTAVGQALRSKGRVHCVVGDISFFYDSNALFSTGPEARPENLSIYLIQNGGGNIFRIIDGPGKQEELESCFITDQGRSAESLCREAGYSYTAVRSEQDLLSAFKNKEGSSTGPTLFEIYTDGVLDSGLFQQLKAGITL